MTAERRRLLMKLADWSDGFTNFMLRHEGFSDATIDAARHAGEVHVHRVRFAHPCLQHVNDVNRITITATGRKAAKQERTKQ